MPSDDGKMTKDDAARIQAAQVCYILLPSYAPTFLPCRFYTMVFPSILSLFHRQRGAKTWDLPALPPGPKGLETGTRTRRLQLLRRWTGVESPELKVQDHQRSR